MDGVARTKKSTRSSSRQHKNNSANNTPLAATLDMANSVVNSMEGNPFEELMNEQSNDDDLYMSYALREEVARPDANTKTNNNGNGSNRMVHFVGETNVHDDIPSMLIAASEESDKYGHNQNSESVMRMGFGNLDLSSRIDGPMDLVSDGLFAVHDEMEEDEDGLMGSDHNGSHGCGSFGSTSADLRAAIVSNWLTDHYEPQENISLPRSVLYDHYLEFCQSQNTEPVNSATFGKIIRSVFPTLRTRRLGTRGNSKYHYFGIGLKTDLLGNDQYSAIYAQYSRPPPSRPRNAKREVSAHESANQHHFTYNGSAYSASSTGAAASHVYSAASSGMSGKEHHGGRTRRGTKSAPGGRRSRRHNRHNSSDASSALLDEQGAEALLLGQHGLISSQSSGNQNGNNLGVFRSLSSPNYDDFSHFLEQICTPVYSNVPSHVVFDSIQAFSLVYQQHVIDLLRAISSHEFTVVEGLSEMFWLNFPPEMLMCLHCDESLRIVAIADDYLYQVLIHTLIPDVLEPVPIGITQNVRQFSKFLEGILQRTLQAPIPQSIIEVKLDAARHFCQVLRRRTSLSHLTQAIRSILCNAEQTHQMLLDWGQVDFHGIREQCDWIMRLKEGFLHWIEASFRTYLQDGVSLHVWSTWIENITDQCINGEQLMGASLEEACSTVILRWTFYSSMIMRDLTLRSAASFGSFHLLNLLFNEYLLYSVEKRLDDHRRSVGLMSFWPTTSASTTTNPNESVENSEMLDHQQTLNNPTGMYAANNQQILAGNAQQNNPNFAFDDFFRKSAVLGPTSSPAVNPATRNMVNPTNNNNSNNNGNAYLSSPLGTKTQMINNPPNKENNANNVSQNGNTDYNLI